MSNSATNLDLINVSQAQKEATANALFDSASPATVYGRRASTTGGLVWGYYGGAVMVGGVPVQIANGTLTLTASATNFVEADPASGAASVNTSGFTAGRIRLYSIDAGTATVASYTDYRVGVVTFDAAGGAAAAIAAHEAEADPHPQYLTQAEGDARYDATGAGTTAAAAAVSAHVAAADPHTQYLTQTRGDARYPLLSAEGQANGLATLGSDGKVPASQLPASAISGGTVTSVGLAVPGLLYTVSGSPITTNGTLTFTLNTQAANTFLAGPSSGAAAAPTMRAITQADLPPQPFDLTAFYPGTPTASAVVTRVPIARAVSFPAGLSGSIGKASAAATASAAFDLQRNGASVGTISFAAGSASATFTAASAIAFAAGDLLSIIAPATADATLANVGLVLAGTR